MLGSLPQPMFEPDRITLQLAALFGVATYSAALIACIELSSDDDALKNEACPAMPVPNFAGRRVAPVLVPRGSASAGTACRGAPVE